MRNYIDDFLAEAMEQSNASHSFQVGGPHGTPTSQIFFFSLLSGEKLYLMRTVPENRLEPEQDEEEDGDYKPYVPDEQRDRDEERYNEHILDDEDGQRAFPLNVQDQVAKAQAVYKEALRKAYGLSYDGWMMDVTETQRELYWNRETNEWFYWDANTMKWIQTIPHDEARVRSGRNARKH